MISGDFVNVLALIRLTEDKLKQLRRETVLSQFALCPFGHFELHIKCMTKLKVLV